LFINVEQPYKASAKPHKHQVI